MPVDMATFTVGTNHTGQHACPMRCFRCKFRPCALVRVSATELHALPRLCRSAANNLPCHQELLAEPDLKKNDDANGGHDGSDDNGGSDNGSKKGDSWFSDSADKGSGMKSASLFELDAAKQLH